MPRSRDGSLIIGRLVEHGRANYQFRADQEVSYFVKLLTQRGERVLWGKDLERAIKLGATKPKLGDQIGARRVGSDVVALQAPTGAPNERADGQSAQLARRNRWVVESVQFFAQRAQLARRVREAHLDAKQAVSERPELASTFLTLRSAEQLAAKRIANAQDRERFVALVREAIAGSIQKGEPLPEIEIRRTPKTLKKLRSDPDRSR